MEILQRCRSSALLISVFLLMASIITAEGISGLPIVNVKEGMPFELTCQLTLFEWPKWQRDGRDIPDDMSDEFVTETKKTDSGLVTRLYVQHAHLRHRGKYRCTAFRNESQQVLVHVAGLSDDKGETKIMLYHHKLELICNLTDSTDKDVKIKWSKNGKPIEGNEKYTIIEAEKKLIVSKTGEDDVGKYTCESTNIKSNATGSKMDINVIGKPWVKLPREVAVVESTTLKLECHVLGYPTPVVKWSFGNGSEIDSKTSERIKFESYKNVTNASIIIKDVVNDDRTKYKCTAENIASEGAPSSAIANVRVKDKLAALWPFLGICAEVVVLCSIILIYEKKRNKTELDESDTDQSPEQKNTPDHGKDVRQRK